MHSCLLCQPLHHLWNKSVAEQNSIVPSIPKIPEQPYGSGVSEKCSLVALTELRHSQKPCLFHLKGDRTMSNNKWQGIIKNKCHQADLIVHTGVYIYIQNYKISRNVAWQQTECTLISVMYSTYFWSVTGKLIHIDLGRSTVMWTENWIKDLK